MQQLNKLCQPAKLYLVVTVIFIVLSVFNGISALTLLVKAAFALIWTLVLNWLCSKGFSGLAWIIVLMPFIFFFLAMFMTMDMVGKEGFKTSDIASVCARDGQVCTYDTSIGVTSVCGLKGKKFECIPVKPGSVALKPPPGIGSCTKEGQSCPYNEFGSGTCSKNLECIPLSGSQPNPYNSSSSSNPPGIVLTCTKPGQKCQYGTIGEIGTCGKKLECQQPSTTPVFGGNPFTPLHI